MADETTHPRPTQAEEPVEDVGASNVDLDEARHGAAHHAPADPEPGHEPDDEHDDDHGHDDHGHEDDHPVDDPRWVIAPLVVGVLVAVVLIIVLGVQSGATPFHQLEPGADVRSSPARVHRSRP